MFFAEKVILQPAGAGAMVLITVAPVQPACRFFKHNSQRGLVNTGTCASNQP